MPPAPSQARQRRPYQASCSVPQDIGATLVRILAYMGGLAVLAIVTASLFRDPTASEAAAVPMPERAEWVNVDRPHPAFELAMPELATVSSNYAILRRNADGARKDVLSYGEAAGAGPTMTIEIYRPGGAEQFLDAASEIGARIIGFDVADDVSRAGTIDSKFGVIPLVDFAIALKRTNPSSVRRCLGFARAFDDPVMQISGWYCSAGDELVDRSMLACALDRLTLLFAGGDTKLAGLFAQAEVKRTFCGQRSPILAATPERDVHVAAPRNAKPAPNVKLRGRLSQR